MAVCERCEGTNFELHDGFYFCTNCALQSQELVQFEEETTTAAATAEDATTRGNETLTQKGEANNLRTVTELSDTGFSNRLSSQQHNDMYNLNKNVLVKIKTNSFN